MKRDGVSKEQVETRIQLQMSDEEKIKRSDFVIQNNEQELLIPQVLAIHKQLVDK
ncbi:MAG TPA: dephospho-CoA kinase [Bacteroidia bacterium]|nr:dephospho-CoA kinase [Bacteroidia bacterium]